MTLATVDFLHVCLRGHWQLTMQYLSTSFDKVVHSYYHLYVNELQVVHFSDLFNNEEYSPVFIFILNFKTGSCF